MSKKSQIFLQREEDRNCNDLWKEVFHMNDHKMQWKRSSLKMNSMFCHFIFSFNIWAWKCAFLIFLKSSYAICR